MSEESFVDVVADALRPKYLGPDLRSAIKTSYWASDSNRRALASYLDGFLYGAGFAVVHLPEPDAVREVETFWQQEWCVKAYPRFVRVRDAESRRLTPNRARALAAALLAAAAKAEEAGQ